MGAVVTTLFFVFLLFFNSVVYARTTYGTYLCQSAGFSCYKTKRGDTWWRLFPNSKERDVVMRINRMNTELYPGLILAIPRSSYNNIMDYSPFPQQIEAPGTKLIYVSLHKQAFGAYNSNGTLEYWGPVSAARGYCPDIGHGCHTPMGHFVIESKEGAGCYSTKFPVGRGGAPMPYCMFFHGGFAMHGSYEVPGFNDSHGCVRMFVNDARWLNQEFTADEHHTAVVITQ